MTQVARGKISYDLASMGVEGNWHQWVRSYSVQPITFGSNNNSILGLVAILKVIAHIRSQNYAVVYFCGVRLSLALRLAKPLLRGAKLVHGIRSDYSSNARLDKITRILERYGSWLIDLYISNSQAAANSLANYCHVSNKKIKVIYNGVPRLDLNSNKPVGPNSDVLTVANVAPRKGYLEYLEVVKLVSSAQPKVKFIAVGTDYMGGLLQQQVREKVLSANFSYEGYCGDINPYMLAAKVFVLPALWGEGCPTVLMEAMMCGLPAIAYDIDGVRELIDDGVNGFVIEKSNTAAMVRAIIKLVNEPNLAKRMGANAQDKAQRLWVLEQCALKHEAALTQLAIS